MICFYKVGMQGLELESLGTIRYAPQHVEMDKFLLLLFIANKDLYLQLYFT